MEGVGRANVVTVRLRLLIKLMLLNDENQTIQGETGICMLVLGGIV